MNEYIKKGLIIGGIWGLIAATSYLIGENMKIPMLASAELRMIILIPVAIFWIPIFFAAILGFQFQLSFIGAPMVGALLGTIAGYLYNKFKK